MHLTATTQFGLEELLADELHALGADITHIGSRAVEFIGTHAREPFFLYVPHLAVHAPFQPPDRPKPSVTKANMYDAIAGSMRQWSSRWMKASG